MCRLLIALLLLYIYMITFVYIVLRPYHCASILAIDSIFSFVKRDIYVYVLVIKILIIII